MKYPQYSAILFVLAACSGTDAPPPAGKTPLPAESASPARAAAPETTTTPRDSGVRIGVHGMGPLRAGMTLGEANAVANGALSMPAGTRATACAALRWANGPKGVLLVVDGGRVVRIEVTSGTVATEEGIRIGDAEDRVTAAYAGRVAVGPQKYTSGHTIVVTPAAPADSAFRLVFETDSNRVTSYRTGKRPQVEYVERCG